MDQKSNEDRILQARGASRVSQPLDGSMLWGGGCGCAMAEPKFVSSALILATFRNHVRNINYISIKTKLTIWSSQGNSRRPLEPLKLCPFAISSPPTPTSAFCSIHANINPPTYTPHLILPSPTINCIMGVEKTVIREGNGVDRPRRGERVTMEYTGWLYDTSAPGNKGSKSVDLRSIFYVNLKLTELVD